MNKPLISEDDVRTKLITLWLKDHGFGLNDFSIEYSFEIQFGHTVKTIHRPRSDILVRNNDGKNLFIIEVKSSSISLSENDKRQAISYARLLRTGGIAPFVIVTNGNETKIYDSFSEELINGSSISINHPHVLAGYQVSGDDLTLRSEALEAFISLSSDNLIQFCHSQVSHRIKLLKSNDLYDGKKYVPQLYIERNEVSDNFFKKLDIEDRSVVVIEGGPQVGKTNFICHTVEKLLEESRPCLFYPAISLQKGLIEEISEDFQWLMGEIGKPYYLIAQKLAKILEKTNQQLIIFIDGWNESDLEVAKAIDDASDKLKNYNIKIVISMTHTAAQRLLLDETGNPSKIAEAISVTAPSVPRLEINPDQIEKNWSVVYLPKYNEEESSNAYTKYKQAYRVDVPKTHKRTNEPFLLRISMEQFSKKVLPDELDEPSLISFSIKSKSQRVIGLKENSVLQLLKILAKEMFINDAPIDEDVALREWRMSVKEEPPKGLFEAALLSRLGLGNDNRPLLDFYYGRERDYLISFFARKWDKSFSGYNVQSTIEELELAIKSNSGKEALMWFFSQKESLSTLTTLLEINALKNKERVYSILLRCLGNSFIRHQNAHNEEWLKHTITHAIESKLGDIKIEGIKLLVLTDEIHDDSYDIAEMIMNNSILNEKLVIDVLNIEEHYPISTLSVSSNVLSLFSSLRYEYIDDYRECESDLERLLNRLLDDKVKTLVLATAKVFAHISPYLFLRVIKERIVTGNIDGSEYVANKEHAVGLLDVAHTFNENYYGDICPGRLESFETEEEFISEYDELSNLTQLIIDVYRKYDCSNEFQGLIKDLKAFCPQVDLDSVEKIDQDLINKHQLKLF